MDKLIYLDNAATTFPKPEIVYETSNQSLRTNFGSLNRSSSSDKNILLETKQLLKSIINANHEYEVALQSSATEAMNTLLRGLEWTKIKNVYITRLEHNATLRTLNDLKQDYNFDIIYLEMKNFSFDLSTIKSQFVEKPPDLLIMNHASNSFGLVTPVSDILELKNTGIVILDMAQTMGLININLSVLDVDAIVFAGHKSLYGIYGLGGFIKKNSLNIKPLITGGTGNDSSNLNMPEGVEKYEAGTRNTVAISCLNMAIKWLLDTGVDNVYNHEQMLIKRFINGVKFIDDLTYYVFDNQIGVISLNYKGLSSDEFGHILRQHNIISRVGLQCAPDSHKLFNTFPMGTVRISFSYFNTSEDVDKLIKIIEDIEFEL